MEDVLLGAFLSKHQKHEEALQHLDRAIQRSPQNAYARIQKGFVLKRLGQIKDAYDIVNNLVMEQPQNQTAWYNRACYGVILGYDKKQVFSDLRRAISLFPPYREFSKRDPDFDDIRNDEGFLTIVSGGNRASDTTKDGSAY